MSTEDLLKERGKTHGHFPDHAAVTQAIKRVLYYPKAQVFGLSANTETETITRYDAVEREGLDMIAHKLGRIVAGDHTEPDHWADIAGYARLVADHLERQRKPSQTIVFREQGVELYQLAPGLDPAGDMPMSQPAPPAMRDIPIRTCKACGAPSGTHYGACPLKPAPAAP